MLPGKAVRAPLAGGALVSALLLNPASPAFAQDIAPPEAVYWLSVETSAHADFRMPPELEGLLPKMAPGGKRLRGDVGSRRSPPGEPRATHAIPPALMLGERLTLVAPKEESASVGAGVVPSSAPLPRPKGRMLVYWGCGDTVRPGQPVILDFTQLDESAAAEALQLGGISRPDPPAPGGHRAYGSWPNHESARRIPDEASLRGLHFVSGNFVPDMQFSIGERHDFMAPVTFERMRRTETGALVMNWKGVPHATGYFATAVARGEKPDDIVVWSSSAVGHPGLALLDYLPPPEVERLIAEKVVLSPQTNSCTVPPGIFRGGTPVLNFIAYGGELNLLHPQRPRDPKEKWTPQWGLKVRLKSTATLLLAEDGPPQP